MWIENLVTSKQFVNTANLNISLLVNLDENGRKNFAIKDTLTNELLIGPIYPIFSEYGSYGYIDNEQFKATFLFLSDKIVVLLTRDTEQKYSYLEGSYTPI